MPPRWLAIRSAYHRCSASDYGKPAKDQSCPGNHAEFLDEKSSREARISTRAKLRRMDRADAVTRLDGELATVEVLHAKLASTHARRRAESNSSAANS